jgi:hypothetical protein
MRQKKTKIQVDGKLRVRQHIIADLSANYVERLALYNGYSVEVFEKDYGYDLNIYTYNSKGEFENGNIFIQLKATDKIKIVNNNSDVAFSMRKQDLWTWYDEVFPVIIVIYDAIKEEAYWVFLQRYLRNLPNFNLSTVKKYFTLNIPLANRMDKNVFSDFRGYKISILKEVKNAITYQ